MLILNLKGSSTRPRSAGKRSPIPQKMWQFTHPRTFGNHVTVGPNAVRLHHRESNVKSHPFLLVWSLRTDISHPYHGQLTAVKTGYPLTSIIWPYRWLRCRPIEFAYFFEVIRWQVTSYQKIVGSSLLFDLNHKFIHGSFAFSPG